MKVRVGDETFAGRALDLRAVGVTPDEVARAIRGDDSADIAVECPGRGPAYEYVGTIRPEMTLQLRPALAAAARSRGRSAPQDAELSELRERLDAFEPSAVDLAAARRRVAETDDSAVEARERVATIQGRVQALRESNAGSSEATLSAAEADLSDATRRLAELETERIAAEQALARARERARASRTERRERLRLRDRVDNLRRAARDHLAATVRDSFADALDALPESGERGDEDSVAAALAVARVADLDAPVVLAGERIPFEGPAAANRWLAAPVVRV